MAQIIDYQTLITSIETYTKRRGDIKTMLSSFIGLAENDIWDVLLVREMESRATSTTSTTSRFLALPDGFIKMRRLKIQVNGEQYDLDEVNLRDLSIRSSASIPAKFAVSEEIEFDRVSDQSYSVEMQYFRSLPGISTTNTTNDILINHPQIYLAGCLKHAFEWTRQEENAQYWERQFNNTVARANRKTRQGRYGPVVSVKPSRGMIV